MSKVILNTISTKTISVKCVKCIKYFYNEVTEHASFFVLAIKVIANIIYFFCFHKYIYVVMLTSTTFKLLSPFF